ncbi:MAG: HAD family phosphatase, partial [Oscillospiraceae bacterium]|nr:HAD family phosphatase [Oscillospiraceae bacterium]
IVTSCVPEHCRTALAHHGLTEFFEQLIFAHDLNMDKSQPEIFFKAAEILGVQPEECTLYDDSVKSCRSARAAGMKVIGVFDPYFASTAADMPATCDQCIHSFEELL